MMKKDKLFYFGVLPGLVIQLVGAYLYFILLADKDYAQSLYFGVKLVILVWPLLWWLGFRALFRNDNKGDVRRSLGWGLLSGLTMSALPLGLFFCSKIIL